MDVNISFRFIAMSLSSCYLSLIASFQLPENILISHNSGKNISFQASGTFIKCSQLCHIQFKFNLLYSYTHYFYSQDIILTAYMHLFISLPSLECFENILVLFHFLIKFISRYKCIICCFLYMFNLCAFCKNFALLAVAFFLFFFFFHSIILQFYFLKTLYLIRDGGPIKNHEII